MVKNFTDNHASQLEKATPTSTIWLLGLDEDMRHSFVMLLMLKLAKA